MSYEFSIKRNDTSPAIKRDLIADGLETIAGASVRFYMGEIVAAPATILSVAPPIVAYEWEPSDTAKAGRFKAEFEVVYADGAKETFPNDRYITVIVTPDLGEPE